MKKYEIISLDTGKTLAVIDAKDRADAIAIYVAEHGVDAGKVGSLVRGNEDFSERLAKINPVVRLDRAEDGFPFRV